MIRPALWLLEKYNHPYFLVYTNTPGEIVYEDKFQIVVKVPEGAQTGKTVRLKGRGMPSLRTRERGDLVVELYIETPTRLTARQKELMRELAGLCGDQQHPKSSGFFKKAKTFWEDITSAEA